MDSAETYKQKREQLVKYLEAGGFIRSKEIAEAFRSVPRHMFVLEEYLDMAYDDIAIPTINKSTISQPSTVATMLELLHPMKGNKILEIGTGSGFQSCLLSKIVGDNGRIVTIEIDPVVDKFAVDNIRAQRSNNIRALVGDGSIGFIDEAPYDGIIYTAAAPEVPKQMLVQLKTNGRIVAPVGTQVTQTLKVIEKTSETRSREKDFGIFAFVPLRGQLGF